jgi:hypothetical protein
VGKVVDVAHRVRYCNLRQQPKREGVHGVWEGSSGAGGGHSLW